MEKTWLQLWKEFHNSKEYNGWDKEFYSWVSKKYPTIKIIKESFNRHGKPLKNQ